MEKFKLITAIDRINYLSDTFIKYYKQFFKKEEFYFLVHAKNMKKVIPYLESHGFDKNNFEVYSINAFGSGNNISKQNLVKTILINQGNIVVYADIDEIIYHPDLKKYIIERPEKTLQAQGIVIVQAKDEPELDVNKTVLEQRNYCKIGVGSFSKVCILKDDFTWEPGRHNRPIGQKLDPELLLFDIGKICKKLIEENNKLNKKIYLTLHPRYSEESGEKVIEMWRPHLPEPVVLIPEQFKKLNIF